MVYVSFPYPFRIISASGSENDRTTKEGGKKEERRMIREQYGNNTGLIRDRYETDRLPSEEEGEYSNFFIMVG